MNRSLMPALLVALLSAAFPTFLGAETGAEAWLRYARLESDAASQYDTLPSTIVCRDAFCGYFFRLSGIADKESRVGHHPNRVEAESMQLTGYTQVAVPPWENASGGQAVECNSPKTLSCSAKFIFEGNSGVFELSVQYFDQNNGESQYRVFVNNKLVDEWIANLQLPATRIGGDSSARRRIPNLTIPHAAEIRIEGILDRDERAAFDYIEINPQPR